MNIQQTASELTADVVGLLGQTLWLGLTVRERLLVEACCFDAAELEAELAAAGDDPIPVTRLQREKRHINAQLANLRAAASSAVAQALWASAAKLLTKTGLVIAAM